MSKNNYTISNILHLCNNTKLFISNYLFYLRNNSIDKSFEELLSKNWLISRKSAILKYYEKNSGNQYSLELEGLAKGLPYQMTARVDDYKQWKENYGKTIEVFYDEEAKLYYTLRNGKRLYFKSSLNNRNSVEAYYEYLAYEQSEHSPHRYLDVAWGGVEPDDIVADVGAAEGIFALDIIDLAKKVYLFEYDEEWIEALERTFAPYKDKVVIVKKYVSDNEDNDCVSLDNFFKEEKIDFVKMDVEGAETQVLDGMKRLIQTSEKLRLAITAYHNKQDEEKILKRLKQFVIQKSEGYLLCGWETAEPPFFRTGIIRAEKHEDKL